MMLAAAGYIFTSDFLTIFSCTPVAHGGPVRIQPSLDNSFGGFPSEESRKRFLSFTLLDDHGAYT